MKPETIIRHESIRRNFLAAAMIIAGVWGTNYFGSRVRKAELKNASFEKI